MPVRRSFYDKLADSGNMVSRGSGSSRLDARTKTTPGMTSLAQRSKFAFGELLKPLWSKDYEVTSEEIDELYDAIGRRNGVVAMSKSADFVDQHKRNSERWDLARIFHASQDAVSFHIVGSEEDPFEGRQAVTARERLGVHGLDVRILPGGHLTTSEHPELLAQIIQEVGPNNDRLRAVRVLRATRAGQQGMARQRQKAGGQPADRL